MACLRLLFVDQDNTLVSPAAEHLLRWRLQQRLGRDASHYAVGSAGLDPQEGRTVASEVTDVLVDAGYSGPRRLRSRVADTGMLADADLILTGTERERQLLTAAFPEFTSRSLLLRRAVTVLTSGSASLPAVDARERSRAIVELLRAQDQGRPPVAGDELCAGEDPHRRRETLAQVSSAVDVLAFILTPATLIFSEP